MNEGFIFLHRQILEWEWNTDPNTFNVFVHLLLMANHTANTWRGIDIQRGQVVTSISTLCKITGLSAKNIRTSLNHLKSTNEVTIKTTNQFSMITICKYDCYQSNNSRSGKQIGKQNGKQVANGGQRMGKQVATNNNDNKIKNDNNAITLSIQDEERAKEVVNFYNIVRSNMPKVKTLNDDRRNAIMQFLSEIEDVKKCDAELCYETIFSLAANSSYLNGDNYSSWRANFDWIIKNWVKIYEGQYNAD